MAPAAPREAGDVEREERVRVARNNTAACNNRAAPLSAPGSARRRSARRCRRRRPPRKMAKTVETASTEDNPIPIPIPSRRGTPSRGTRGLIVRRVPAARLKASEFVAVQLSGRALRRRLLLRIVLRLGGRKRQSDEPGGDRGRNRSLADTHGASGIGPRAPRPANVSDARRRSLLGLGGAG